MSSTPKFFNDEMVGAPVLSGTAGALIALLDACLVNGFGIKTADSVVIAGGVATVNYSTGHSFQPQSIAVISGATPAGLNGEQRVLTTATNKITFATTLADTTATGTISTKLAPLGWTKVYSGTNKAVYKPAAVEASSALLRVDDTGTTTARVRMFESMTDVDTGINPGPTDAKVSGGLHFWKSATASALARPWTVFGDDRNVYFAPASDGTAANKNATIHHFGDLVSYKSGDAFAGTLIGDTGAVSTSVNGNAAQSAVGIASTQVVRAHTGIGGSISADRRPMVGSAAAFSGGDTTLGNFPAAANFGLFLTRMLVGQAPLTTSGPRGYLPGLLYVPQGSTNGGQFARGTIIDGTGEFVGRKVYAIPQTNTSPATSTNDYAAFFDLTGPWRE